MSLAPDQTPSEEDEEQPGLRTSRRPLWHVSIFALGALMVSQMGSILYYTMLLRRRVGVSETVRILNDQESFQAFIDALPVVDTLMALVAGQGCALAMALGLWRALFRGHISELGLTSGPEGPAGLVSGAIGGIALVGAVVAGGLLLGVVYAGWKLVDPFGLLAEQGYALTVGQHAPELVRQMVVDVSSQQSHGGGRSQRSG